MDNEIKDIDTIENLKDLMALAQAADMKGRNDDVEQRLQQFYRKQKAKKTKARLWSITMAAAACLALLLTLALWKGTADDETLMKEQQPIVFNIAKPKANIMVRTEKGKKLQDIQWGNHDILWMGACAGNNACICNVLRLSLRYANLVTLEEGYGINLMPLATFAMETYAVEPS